jgi:hypothetical protein
VREAVSALSGLEGETVYLRFLAEKLIERKS